MCEDMANGPDEDNSTYVLTEDMIDAAMTQHIAFQGDTESDEDLSSQDESRDSLDTLTCDTPSTSNDTQTTNHIPTDGAVQETTSFNNSNNAMSILVIETGLDKSKSVGTKDESDVLSKETNITTVPAPPPAQDKKNTSNNGLNSSSETYINGIKPPQANSIAKTLKDQNEESCSIDQRLPLLKRILTDKTTNMNIDNNNTEAIDLCNSDTDGLSDSDLTEFESLDNELKSVMESNLMAEVGITVEKQKELSSNAKKIPEISPPKISVKSIAQISSNLFNHIPNSNDNREKNFTHQPTSTVSSATNIKPNENNINSGTPDISIREKEQVPTTIQINKIAVPHQTIVNSQGRKMKCVYVRNPTSLPLVISSTQSSNNKNVKYVVASQVQKNPIKMSPIAALANMTKKNPQLQAIVPKKTELVAVKTQKPNVVKNFPPAPHQLQQDNNLDSLIKTLLFHNLMSPYVPPDVPSSTTTHTCLECNDRFVLESSLAQHLGRRSINIRYWCRVCKNEIPFYNRCALFKHLREHNVSIKHIETTCITFSPLSKEMVDNGIISSNFKDLACNSLPNELSILNKIYSERRDNLELQHRKPMNTNNVVNDKMVTTVNNYINSNYKLTTIVGQSKSICSQSQNSLLLTNSIPSTVSSAQPSKPLLPLLLPANHKLSVVQTVPKPTKASSAMKTVPKSVILLCNKFPNSDNVKCNPHSTNTITPNVVSESLAKTQENSIVIDDDEIHGNANNNIEVEEEIDVENVITERITDDNQFSSASCSESSQNSRIQTKRKKSLPESKKPAKRICSECNQMTLNIAKHLNGFNRPVNSLLACKVCQIIMPTPCALKIHHRIHVKMPPHKCPDCGKDFDTWDELYPHLKFSCGHLAKCMRYMCLSCKAHFPSTSALSIHISHKHARDIFKCNVCPVAFFSKPSLIKHMLNSHSCDKSVGMDYKQCSLCPRKLVPMDKFVSHVQEHTKIVHVAVYGYKCPMCSIVFANKMAFVIHQIKEKNNTLDEKDDKKIKTLKSSHSKNVVDSNRGKDVNCDYGTQLSDSNSELDDEPAIIRKVSGPLDEFSMAEKDPLSLEGWEYAPEQRVKEKKEELCIMCKKNSVYLLPEIDLSEQSLCCKQCVKPLDIVDTAAFNNRMEIENGQEMKFFSGKSTKNQTNDSLKRKRKVQRSLSCDRNNAVVKHRRTSDISLNNGSPDNEMDIDLLSDLKPFKKKSKKKQIKERIYPTGQAHIQGQIIASKSPDELVCSKCEFVADNRETFLQHIVIHRTDPNTFQCLECGLCFVVLPSLERHLHMHHEIKDVNNYIQRNSSCLPQNIIMAEDETDDNQCQVCYEMFDSNSSLEKHFRTHGMAFMSSLSKSP